MTHSTCDRDYVSLLLPTAAPISSTPSGITPDETSDMEVAEAVIFRAGLLYVAADLHRLASLAPEATSRQLSSLSALITTIADRS